MQPLYDEVHDLIGEGGRLQMFVRVGYADTVIAAPRRGLMRCSQTQAGEGKGGSRLNQDDARLLYFRMFTEIGIISQLSSNRLDARAARRHVGRAVQRAVNHFVRLGGQSAPSRLARAFQVTKGAMTNTLQRLEAQGLVKIVADPADARAKLVEITAAGRKTASIVARPARS